LEAGQADFQIMFEAEMSHRCASIPQPKNEILEPHRWLRQTFWSCPRLLREWITGVRLCSSNPAAVHARINYRVRQQSANEIADTRDYPRESRSPSQAAAKVKPAIRDHSRVGMAHSPD